jgi:hypothetical protein
MSFGGSLNINDFRLVDTALEERLAGWTGLDINRVEFSFTQKQLDLSELRFDQPFGRIRIAEDLTTNISDVMITPDQADQARPEDAGPFGYSIGGIDIQDGGMDFTDLSLPLPFAARISNLEGAISALSSKSSEPAAVSLEGQVNEYGEASISGTINAFSFQQKTDIDLGFRNLDMSRLTPYTIQFAGHAIDAGRLDLDLKYKIDQQQLVGENNIVIREIKLGEKVDHPDAASLPLGLAVALLSDSEGVIEVDLPVSGDMSDPEFKIGGIVAKAIFNLITKIVTAPFALLGNLVGFDSEDFGTLRFTPGEAELSPPDREQLVKLAEAMRLRPELRVTVAGVYNENLDSQAIRIMRIDEQIESGVEAEEAGSEELSTSIRRRVVEALFGEVFPGQDLAMIQAEYTPPATDENATSVLDELAYISGLRERLIERYIVDEARLAELAQARANAALVSLQAHTEGGVIAVEVGAIEQVEPDDDDRLPLELSVEAGKAPE